MKLYLPTTSLNFNSILSTESIAPEAFYEARQFGYTTFNKIDLNPFTQSLLLYSALPIFQRPERGQDDYPLILQLETQDIDMRGIEEVGVFKEGKIFQCNHTLYLNPFSTQFFFLKEEDRRIILSKSETSLETKLVPLYCSVIKVFNGQEPSFEFQKKILDSIVDVRHLNTASIQKDNHINHLKGFLYAFMMGKYYSLDTHTLEMKKQIRTIQHILHSASCSWQDMKPMQRTALSQAISLFDQHRLNLFDYFQKLDRRFNTTHAKEIIQTYIEDFNLSPIKISGEDSSPKVLANDIKLALEGKPIQRKAHSPKSPQDIHGKGSTPKRCLFTPMVLTLDFSEDTNPIARGLDSKYAEEPQFVSLALQVVDTLVGEVARMEERLLKAKTCLMCSEIRCSVTENKLLLFSDDSLKKESQKIYLQLLNDLCLKANLTTQTFSPERRQFALSMATYIRSLMGESWAGSWTQSYLNGLLQLLHGETKPFEIATKERTLLSDIALFCLKGEDIDGLEDMLIEQGIEQFQFVFGFYGAIFGFASLPKTMTTRFYARSDEPSFKVAYTHIFKELHHLELNNTIKHTTKTSHKTVTPVAPAPKAPIHGEKTKGSLAPVGVSSPGRSSVKSPESSTPTIFDQVIDDEPIPFYLDDKAYAYISSLITLPSEQQIIKEQIHWLQKVQREGGYIRKSDQKKVLITDHSNDAVINYLDQALKRVSSFHGPNTRVSDETRATVIAHLKDYYRVRSMR